MAPKIVYETKEEALENPPDNAKEMVVVANYPSIDGSNFMCPLSHDGWVWWRPDKEGVDQAFVDKCYKAGVSAMPWKFSNNSVSEALEAHKEGRECIFKRKRGEQRLTPDNLELLDVLRDVSVQGNVLAVLVWAAFYSVVALLTYSS